MYPYIYPLLYVVNMLLYVVIASEHFLVRLPPSDLHWSGPMWGCESKHQLQQLLSKGYCSRYDWRMPAVPITQQPTSAGQSHWYQHSSGLWQLLPKCLHFMHPGVCPLHWEFTTMYSVPLTSHTATLWKLKMATIYMRLPDHVRLGDCHSLVPWLPECIPSEHLMTAEHAHIRCSLCPFNPSMTNTGPRFALMFLWLFVRISALQKPPNEWKRTWDHEVLVAVDGSCALQ